MSVPAIGHEVASPSGAETAPPPSAHRAANGAQPEARRVDAEGATPIRPSSVGRHDLFDYNIPKDLRLKHERILENLMADMEHYMALGKNNIPDEMKDLYLMYQANKGTLLDTGQGWALATSILNKEMYVRLAKVQKDIYQEIKGNKQDKDITLSVEDTRLARGFINKIWGKVVPEAIPFFGLRKLAQSAAKHEKITIKFEDFDTNLSRLPQGYQDYLNYLDPGGSNPQKMQEWLAQYQEARIQMYREMGAKGDELLRASPWEDFHPEKIVDRAGTLIRTDPATLSQGKELFQASWNQVLYDEMEKLVRAGMVGGGGTLDLTNASHSGWLMFEAMNRSVRRHTGEYIAALAKSQLTTTRTHEQITARIAELRSTKSAENQRAKTVAGIQAQIEQITGKKTADGSTTLMKGALTKLDEELLALEAKIKGAEGGQTLVQQTDAAKVAYETAHEAAEAERGKVAELSAKITRLKTEIAAREKEAKKKVADIRKQSAYLRLSKMDLRTPEELLAELTQQRSAIARERDGELAAAKGAHISILEKIRADHKSKESALELKYDPLIKAARSPKTTKDRVDWKVLTDRITRIENDSNEFSTSTTTDLQRSESDQTTHQLERKTKEAAEKRLKVAYTQKKKESHPVLAQIEDCKARIAKQREKLLKLQNDLYEAQHADVSELKAKTRKQLAQLELINASIFAPDRFDTIMDQVTKGISDRGLMLGKDELTSVNPIQVNRKNTYPEGYLRILDHIFQWKDSVHQYETFALAVELLPPQLVGKTLREEFNLPAVLPAGAVATSSVDDVENVFKAIHLQGDRIAQDDLTRGFIALVLNLKKKARDI